MYRLIYLKPTVRFNHTIGIPHQGSESKPILLLPGSRDALTANNFFPQNILLISVRMKATLIRPFWTRKDTQKSFRDACLWVLWTLLISIIEFFSSIFSFDFFCFLLHYTFGLALNRPGYLGIVALASCTYYGLSLKPSHNLVMGQRCTSPPYTDALSDPGSSLTLFFAKGQAER